LSSEPVARAEIIHHCDSLFAILLVAVVFLSSVAISILGRYHPEAPEETVLSLAVAVSMTVLLGFVGILQRSWYWKIAGWFFAFWVLMVLIASVFLPLAYAAIPATTYLLVFIGMAVLVSVIPVILAWGVVLDQYYGRLALASCQDERLTRLRSHRKLYYFSFLVMSVFFTNCMFFFLL